MHWRVTYSDPSALTQILKFLVRQEVIPGFPQTPPTQHRRWNASSVFISSRNEARRSARSAPMIAPRLCRPRKTTCLCGALLVRLRRPCGEPLVLGGDYGHNYFCRYCCARCEALALVPCYRNGTPRINLGYLALQELDLHPRLVCNCVPGSGPRIGCVCGRACPCISAGIAH